MKPARLPARRLAAAALGGAFLAAALGLFRLAHDAFWADEAYNVVLAREPWISLVKNIGDHEPSQAVYLLLFKVWLALVGEGEFAARLPSVMFAAIATGLLVVLAARLFGPRTAVPTAVLGAANAAVVEWSQYTRAYSLAVLAAVATTLLYVRARDARRLAPWLAYGAAGAVAVYCHFYAGFVLVAHAVSAFVESDRATLRRLAAAWAVIAIGLLPFGAYLVAGTRSPVEWIPAPDVRLVADSLYQASGWNVALLVVALVGIVVLFAGRGEAAERWKAALLAAWAVGPLVLGVAVSLVQPALVPRYVIVSAPAIALAASVALATVRSRAVAAAGIVVLLVLSAVRLADVYGSQREDWRSAATLARETTKRGGRVALVPDFPWRALSVYAPDVPRAGAPEGREVLILVWESADREDAASPAARFVGAAPYRRTSVEPLGKDLHAERWVRTR